MPASNQQTTLWVADTLSWLLHFTRKFNLAILSRFPGSRLIAPLSFSCYGTMDLRDLLLCYSDRIAQDLHLIPSSDCYADNNLHFICSIWNYTDIIITRCQFAVNNLHNILSNFYHFMLLFTPFTAALLFFCICPILNYIFRPVFRQIQARQPKEDFL